MMTKPLRIRKTYFKLIEEVCEKDKSDMKDRSLKTAEEAGELCRAVLGYNKTHGNTYRELGKDEVLEEAVDTILSAMSVLLKLPYHDKVTQDEFDSMMDKKLEKWFNNLKN